jgi:hypothetical protein
VWSYPAEERGRNRGIFIRIEPKPSDARFVPEVLEIRGYNPESDRDYFQSAYWAAGLKVIEWY